VGAKIESRSARIAALLNLFFWGVGYIYLGKRKGIGAGLFLAELIEHMPILFLGMPWFIVLPGILYPLGHILISVMLAVDVYEEAIGKS